VSFEELMQSSEKRFETFDIKYDEIISSKIHPENTYSEYGQSEHVAGKTTFYLLDGVVLAAVFIIFAATSDQEGMIKQ
jgi:hypothetical protein